MLVTIAESPAREPVPASAWRAVLRSRRAVVGLSVLAAVIGACVLSLPWTLREGSRLYFNAQVLPESQRPPAAGQPALWWGTDLLGRSVLGRCLLGGTTSLAVGVAAAGISVVLGVAVGLVAGYRGGWTDALLMRAVDVLYGLPYVLLVVLFRIAFEKRLSSLVVMFLAIGLVSWLTMARVVRGQVLSLRGLAFVEAARAAGLTETRIFLRHLLPNLVGPIIVYATLTVPQAMLQEAFLSFLGVGIQPPLPTWGSMASEGLQPALNPIYSRWWLLAFPCILLAVTLLSLNFAGDGLRDAFDPRRDAAKP